MAGAPVPSVRVDKKFKFKGGDHVWSNRYFFSGGTPSSDANWKLLFDAIVNIEKTIFDLNTSIVQCVGYASGSDVPVSFKTYSTAGTGSFTGANTPGEAVALARWATTARSSKNHPIYAFSYWHGVIANDTTYALKDSVVGSQKTAMTTYANGWVSGITAGGVTAVRATMGGHTCNGALVEEYITHRDFRPTTSV